MLTREVHDRTVAKIENSIFRVLNLISYVQSFPSLKGRQNALSNSESVKVTKNVIDF